MIEVMGSLFFSGLWVMAGCAMAFTAVHAD